MVVMGVGSAFLIKADSEYRQLSAWAQDPQAIPGDTAADKASRADAVRRQGKQDVATGWAVLGAGTAVVAGGVAWWWLTGREEAVALVPTAGGAGLVVSGRFD